MSLLTVNGIDLPAAADTVRMGARVLGDDVAAEDGSPHRARSAYLDVLSGATRPLSPVEALAWRGLLEGRGHRLSCDSDPARTSTDPSAEYDPYTSRGLYLAGVASRRGGNAQYGLEVSGADSVISLDTDSHFAQAIAVEAAATNLYPERVRRAGDLGSGSSLAGFATGGAGTLALETVIFFEGANSIKFTPVTPATDFFQVAATYRAATDGVDSYVHSFYMKASTPMNVIASIETDAPSSIPATFALTTTWRRFTIPFDYTGAPGVAEMWLKWIPQSAGTIYVDAIQAEQGVVNASSWVGAAATATDTRSGTPGLAQALSDFRRQDDVTVMGWFLGPHWNLLTDAYYNSDATLWSMGTEAEGVSVRHNGSTGALDVRIVSSLAAEATATTYATGIGNKAWHHVAVVLRRAPTTGHYKAALYVDGALVGSPSSTYAIPSWGSAPTFYLGRKFAAATAPFNGMVDELVVLPFALTADMIADTYDAVFSDLPRVNVAGDLFGETVPCLPSVTGDGLRFIAAQDAAAGFTHRNAVLAFQLAQAGR